MPSNHASLRSAQTLGGTLERFQADKPSTTPPTSNSRHSVREASCELVGPYQLLAEIARGELTTVHLAKKHGALGFQRLYALKRLRPGLSRNLDMVELLLDEARLVSGIHHAHIAGVLDVGADAGSFVVLEYVEGENLETLLARAGRERDPRFIVPPFVDALYGLHALHTATDDDGNPAGIVHQAPRARHLLLGVDGSARLGDFSQVRANTVRPSRARSDRLKVAYMAPEQALSPDAVDFRADLFIAGIALWEALTGERLFAADTDEQTFQNMLHRRILKPSEVGVRPPRCFDAICMRALERDPDQRYASALEMARDLRDTAINQALYATPAELGVWVRRLAGAELRERRRLAGNDSTSANGIPLDTPAVGLDVTGLVRERSAPSTRPKGPGDDPYASGRIYGGSYARVSLDEEDDKTPAFGTRRSAPPASREDEPTAKRSLPPRAAATTVPMLAPAAKPAATPSSPPQPLLRGRVGAPGNLDGSGLYGAAAALAASKAKKVDPDQTQPSVFVPARPGGRRDGRSTSPGAYSQVESSRRSRSSLPPSDKTPSEELTLATLEPPARNPYDGGEPTTSRYSALLPSGEPAIAETPLLLQEPRSGAESASADGRRSAAPVYGPKPVRFVGAVTETVPLSVSRRDSTPSRLPIPSEPVGEPMRGYPISAQHELDLSEALDVPGETVGSPREPMVFTPRQAALPLLDSLAPPQTASFTEPPLAPPRRSYGKMASGVLVAIIVLAAGVGLKNRLQVSETGAVAPQRVVQPDAPVLTPAAREQAVAEQKAAVTDVQDAGAAALPRNEPASASSETAAAPQPSKRLTLPVKKVEARSVPAATAAKGAPAAVGPKRPQPASASKELPANPY